MTLTLNEQILLLAIWKLGDEAYGVRLRELVCDYLGKDVAFGTLYNNLDQLIKKGYALSYKGDPTAVRGGKAKVYYQITKEGTAALQAARELQEKLWDGIPKFAIGRGK